MNLVNDPGLWQHFINRYDNIGRPIMEVKQKYLTEINAYESTLAQGNFGAGGGTALTPTPSASPPTVYTFNVSECCGSCQTTVYTTSTSIIIGTVLYANIGLTTVFTSGCPTIRAGVCLPIEDGSFANDGFTLNGSGVVTSINQFVNCQ